MTSTGDIVTSLYSDRARQASAAARPPDFEVKVNFEQGLPDPRLFPLDLLKQCFDDTFDLDGATACKYFGEGGPEEMRYGNRWLRQVLADRLAVRSSRSVDPAQVLLVHGSTDGLALAVNAFVGPGDGVVTEQATYPHTRSFIVAAGATIETVPLDDEGMVVDALDGALERLAAAGHRPKMIYTLPTFHSPTGTVLPLERRRRLLEVAERWQVMVLEDNCYYHFAYDRPPPPTLFDLDSSGLVLQSDSFSKYIAPGLRMAWVAGSPAAIDGLARIRQDFAVNQLVARALARYVERGHFDDHLDQMRKGYRHKRDVTADALERHCSSFARFRVPEGGFNFWVEIPGRIDWPKALQGLAEAGVAVRSGEQYSGGNTESHYVRLSFIQVPEEDIDWGIEAFAGAISTALTP